MIKFYWVAIRRAFYLTFQFFNLTSLVAVFRSVALWLACTAIIAALFEAHLESKIETAIAFALGFAILFPVVFIVTLIIAPASIYTEITCENAEIKNDLKLAANLEFYLQELSALFFEGKSKYKVGFYNESDKEKWIHSMDKWADEVETKIRTHFSIREIHSFRNAGDFSYIPIDHVSTSEIGNLELLAKYSHRIWNLDQLIQMGTTEYELSTIMKYSEK